MTRRLYRLILIFGFSFTATNTYSEIYRWVDEHGNVHFGDSQHANKQTENISDQLQQQNIDHSAKRTEKTLQQIDQRQQAKQTEQLQRENQVNPNQLELQRICQNAKQRLKTMQGPVVFYDENNKPMQVSESERQQRADALSKQIEENCR